MCLLKLVYLTLLYLFPISCPLFSPYPSIHLGIIDTQPIQKKSLRLHNKGVRSQDILEDGFCDFTSVPLLICFRTVLNYVVQYYFVLALLYFAKPCLCLGHRMDSQDVPDFCRTRCQDYSPQMSVGNLEEMDAIPASVLDRMCVLQLQLLCMSSWA